MTSSYGNILYYANVIIWTLAWILIAVAAGVGSARSGRRILIWEMIFAILLAISRIVNFVMVDSSIGVLRPRGPFSSGSYTDLANWNMAYGIITALLFAGFCTCLAIDRFTLRRPNVQSFPVGNIPPRPPYQHQQY